ncbi:MAG: YkgJ family cysteine cluster protein [Minicystis sp.]
MQGREPGREAAPILAGVTAPDSGFEATRIHLRVLGRDREFELPMRTGTAKVGDLLPTARAISVRVTALAVAHEEAQGRTVSCRAGCAACCRQLVPISVVEARALAAAVEALPPARREIVRARFAAAVREMERLGLLDAAAAPGRMVLQSHIADPKAAWRDVGRRYFDAQIPCPLLEDERCSLYEERPLVCREYLVTTPADRCAQLDGGARTVPRPARTSEALATAAREITGEALPMLPLPLSLEWAEAAGGKIDVSTEGENLFNHLISAVDEVGG